MKVWAVVCVGMEFVGWDHHLFRSYSESQVENVYIFSSKELANKFISGAFKDWDYAGYEIFEQDLDYPN